MSVRDTVYLGSIKRHPVVDIILFLKVRGEVTQSFQPFLLEGFPNIGYPSDQPDSNVLVRFRWPVDRGIWLGVFKQEIIRGTGRYWVLKMVKGILTKPTLRHSIYIVVSSGLSEKAVEHIFCSISFTDACISMWNWILKQVCFLQFFDLSSSSFPKLTFKIWKSPL